MTLSAGEKLGGYERWSTRGFENTGHGWDVTPDGQRFLITEDRRDDRACHVVLNWPAWLRK